MICILEVAPKCLYLFIEYYSETERSLDSSRDILITFIYLRLCLLFKGITDNVSTYEIEKFNI